MRCSTRMLLPSVEVDIDCCKRNCDEPLKSGAEQSGHTLEELSFQFRWPRE